MRELLKKYPWAGWVLAAALLGVTVWLWIGRSANESPYSPERMQQSVTIKYTDTGETATMPRGRFEKMLREMGGKLDPNVGLLNPKTGKPTGFLFNQAEWDETIKRVNAAIDTARAKLPDDIRKTLTDKPVALPEGPDPKDGDKKNAPAANQPPASAEPPKNPK